MFIIEILEVQSLYTNVRVQETIGIGSFSSTMYMRNSQDVKPILSVLRFINQLAMFFNNVSKKKKFKTIDLILKTKSHWQYNQFFSVLSCINQLAMFSTMYIEKTNSKWLTIIQRLKAIDSIINTFILLLITTDYKKSNVHIYIFYLKHSIYNKS